MVSCHKTVVWKLTYRFAGRLKEPERMITAKISLEEGVEKGFKALLHKREKHVKILIGVDDDP